MTFAGGRTVTVLLVEDSPDARYLLTTLLEVHGLRVLAAATAQEALEAARQAGPIDVLLSDLRLPDGDGTQVASSLERIQPGIRSLFISGDPPPPLAPGQAFLRKPARIVAILREIRALVPQSAYGRAS
ncbi:MAG TPA: response regulator [Kofleriaceae bacterium]|jgi:CheY-like chemotaxis protein